MQPGSAHLSREERGCFSMDFWDVVRGRRSIRAYEERPVDEELVRRIISAARWAPSGGNCQPWRFYAVFDPVKREALVRCTFNSNLPGHPPQAWLREAPVLILVCMDRRKTTQRYDRWGREYLAPQDCAAAVENMLLAAVALGLGGCWVGGLNMWDASEAFDLPAHLEPFCVVAVGYPKEVPEPRPRLDLDEIYTRI